ncbi:ferritin-like domain-containing protein [Leptolyngbya ohadii]|uniref:ferritin-like domain-containing protein n=1 Tax=Leptolyngbya ohadii TaxID=1962290 RepID=UPI000B5A01B9|nr:ferritin-like domain-containing protein [Leptolyngbya ohadii]
MNLLTQVLHLVGSGATAYITAANMRDPKSRPNLLAGFQLAESGSVPFLEALSQRAANEGDDWLAEKLAKHAQDERRHGQIFAHALKQLNKQVIDFKSLPQETRDGKPDERRRSPFFEAYYEGYDVKEIFSPDRMDWLVFMGSTYILELDACKDFVRMANALPDDPVSQNLKKGMMSIAKDEEGHASYLQEAIERRLGYFGAEALITEWRTRKVNAMVAMVTNLLKKGGQMPSLAMDGVPSEVAEGMLDPDGTGEVTGKVTAEPIAA